MKKTKTFDPVAHQKSLLDSNILNIKKRIEKGILPLNPTRLFEVNERVNFGAHKESYIREVYEDGLYYRIESLKVQRDRNNPPANEEHIIEWHDLLPFVDTRGNTNFHKEETYRITQLNVDILSLLSKVYHSGVDFDIEYQREHVWELNDKVALLDSIFNNIDIGKFVFIQRDFGHKGKLYEILDGKQRLTTLTEFYEDRFKYNGVYFSEMSHYDRHCFTNHQISFGYLVNPNKQAIFESFIKLNTCGKPMDNKHINHVKKLLSEL